jgi:TonB family protein
MGTWLNKTSRLIYLWLSISILLHVFMVQLYLNSRTETGNAISDPVVHVDLLKPVSKNEIDKSESTAPIKDADVAQEVTKEEGGYLEDGKLDARPYFRLPIVVPYPDAKLGKPKGSVTLILYVDKYGHVEKVETYQADVPKAFEQAAINAFLHAKMEPGRRNGNSEATITKVYVEFEAK